MKKDSEKLRDTASTMLGDAALEASLEELRSGIALKAPHTKRRLLERVAEVIDDPNELTAERDRVLVTRLVVALLPLSVDIIERLLTPVDQAERLAEVQFSLFVALSDALDFVDTRDLRAILLGLVLTYLLRVKSDEAQAAWMAGDLLGDHWPLDASLPILLSAARKADHPAGREAALHGLSHALNRGTKKQQWEIMGVLREVADSDSSAAIRTSAALIASDFRGL